MNRCENQSLFYKAPDIIIKMDAVRIGVYNDEEEIAIATGDVLSGHDWRVKEGDNFYTFEDFVKYDDDDFITYDADALFGDPKYAVRTPLIGRDDNMADGICLRNSGNYSPRIYDYDFDDDWQVEGDGNINAKNLYYRHMGEFVCMADIIRLRRHLEQVGRDQAFTPAMRSIFTETFSFEQVAA